MIEAIRARLGEDRGWVAQVPPGALSQAARLVPELAVPGVDAAVAHDDPGAAERFLAGVWETLVIATYGPRPGVILLDDAQWADEASLRLLAYGLRRMAERPVLVLLTWRTPNDHPLRRVLATMERAGHGAVIRLQRLGLREVGALLDAATAERYPSGLQQRLFDETEGLPFLIVEYLHGLDSDASDAWTLPASARELLLSRLDPVTETGRQVLAAAAVLGRSFEPDTVRVTSGRSEDETVTALEELTGHGLVREGTVDYDFSHEHLRAMVYAETSLARRRLLHRRAARTTLDPAITARHLRLAGEEAAAAMAYARAADQAREIFANAEAIAHLRDALALAHPDPAALHADIGELLTLQGDYAGALRSYELAASIAPDERLGAIEHHLGQVHHRRGDWGLAEAHLLAALKAVPVSHEEMRARITADLSLAAHAGGDPVRAADLALQARELALAAGDLRALAQADNLLGLLASSGDRTADALGHLESSLALATEVDDVGARVAALNNLALAYRARGDLDMALELTGTHSAGAPPSATGTARRRCATTSRIFCTRLVNRTRRWNTSRLRSVCSPRSVATGTSARDLEARALVMTELVGDPTGAPGAIRALPSAPSQHTGNPKPGSQSDRRRSENPFDTSTAARPTGVLPCSGPPQCPRSPPRPSRSNGR